MIPWQLEGEQNYGALAGWWIVVSDDGEEELSGPVPTKEKAEELIARISRKEEV